MRKSCAARNKSKVKGFVMKKALIVIVVIVFGRLEASNLAQLFKEFETNVKAFAIKPENQATFNQRMEKLLATVQAVSDDFQTFSKSLSSYAGEGFFTYLNFARKTKEIFAANKTEVATYLNDCKTKNATLPQANFLTLGAFIALGDKPILNTYKDLIKDAVAPDVETLYLGLLMGLFVPSTDDEKRDEATVKMFTELFGFPANETCLYNFMEVLQKTVTLNNSYDSRINKLTGKSLDGNLQLLRDAFKIFARLAHQNYPDIFTAKNPSLGTLVEWLEKRNDLLKSEFNKTNSLVLENQIFLNTRLLADLEPLKSEQTQTTENLEKLAAVLKALA